MPVTGYVSGQTIPFVCDVDNASNVTVERLKFTLWKFTSYHTQSPRLTKLEEKTIGEMTLGPFNPRENRNIKQTIDIPPLPPSNLDNCGIIDLKYELRVACEVSGLHANLTGIIPITLGTVPLSDFQPPASQNTAVDVSMLPTQPVSPETDGIGGAIGWSMNNQLPNLPPPVFHESEYKASVKDNSDSQFVRFQNPSFAPRYPTFTAFKPSAPGQD